MSRLKLLAAFGLLGVGTAGTSLFAALIMVFAVRRGEIGRSQLAAAMWRASAVVLPLGVLAAVLLARRRWWLVDRVVDQHEQFLREAAHELRSPLQHLSTVTDDGLSGRQDASTALRQVQLVMQRTDRVIEDIATLSRIEIGNEDLELTALRLDSEAQLVLDQRDDTTEIVLHRQPTVVAGHAGLLRIALDNLVENALSHGRDAKGKAEVTITVADHSVTVEDRGPGVNDPSLLSDMPLRPRRRRIGLGRPHLGLVIAGRVTRAHGGQLVVENRPGGGARFILRLAPVDP